MSSSALKIEVGDTVTITGEVTHVLEEGRTLIVLIPGAMAPISIGPRVVATVTKPKKWKPPRDVPD